MAGNAAGRTGWKRGSAPRRAGWMCNRVAHTKEASSEEIPTLIDRYTGTICLCNRLHNAQESRA
jgi:hypothetical protein